MFTKKTVNNLKRNFSKVRIITPYLRQTLMLILGWKVFRIEEWIIIVLESKLKSEHIVDSLSHLLKSVETDEKSARIYRKITEIT